MNTKHIQIAKSLGCTGEFPGDFNKAVERCADMLTMLERVTDDLFFHTRTYRVKNESWALIENARALITSIKGV